jgi:hypothetical protein
MRRRGVRRLTKPREEGALDMATELVRWPIWGVYLRDQCRCQYCGFNGAESLRAWWNLEVDHLYPRSPKNPSDRINPALVENELNRVIACRTCNHLKGNFVPDWCDRIPDDINNEWRSKMIQSARDEIKRREVNQANSAQYYELMMRDLGLR